jgi:hypothetical protein
MPTTARKYLSLSCLGDFQGCRELLRQCWDAVKGLNPPTGPKSVSFFGVILVSEEDITNEALDSKVIHSFSNGVFPILWVNITYNPERVVPEAFRSVEQAFSLQLIATVESKQTLLP